MQFLWSSPGANGQPAEGGLASTSQRKKFVVKNLNLEAIVAQLDAPYDGKWPKRALREAQRRGAEIVPPLIDLVKESTAAVQAGETPNTNGPLFALYLLTEFRAYDALAAIVEAVSLPGEGPFECSAMPSPKTWTACWRC